MKIEECEIGMIIVFDDDRSVETVGAEVKIKDIDLMNGGVQVRDKNNDLCWIYGGTISRARPRRGKSKSTPETEAFRKEQYFAIMRDVIATRVSSVSIGAETDTIAKCVLNSLDTAIEYWEQNK